jgi:murein DD-endopeptidase MepM/ murein hydrolase activator NlpD
LGYIITQYPEKDSPLQLLAKLKYLKQDWDETTILLSKAWNISNNPSIANDLLVCLMHNYDSKIELALQEPIRSKYLSNFRFAWPIDSRRISSQYGWRPNPAYSNWTKRLMKYDFHGGIDLPEQIGIPVRSTADGLVVESKSMKAAGEAVFIQHKNGMYSAYFHMNKRLVNIGDKVKLGDQIGEVGNTGRSGGAHLHFGLYDNNWKTVPPLEYLE